MKKSIISVFTFLMSLCAFAGNGLVVTQQFSGQGAKPGSTVVITWYVSQSQCKMKMEYKDDQLNSVTWFIPDMASGKLLMYAEGDVKAGAQKTYYAVPVADIKASANTNVARVNIEHTGETKVIAGFNCEKMVAKTNKGTTEMWVTTDFKPDFFKFYPFFQSDLALLALNNDGLQGFPVEYTSKDNLGNIISSNTFVSGAGSNLTNADFKVPADYKSAEQTKAPAGK